MHTYGDVVLDVDLTFPRAESLAPDIENLVDWLYPDEIGTDDVNAFISNMLSMLFISLILHISQVPETSILVTQIFLQFITFSVFSKCGFTWNF